MCGERGEGRGLEVEENEEESGTHRSASVISKLRLLASPVLATSGERVSIRSILHTLYYIT